MSDQSKETVFPADGVMRTAHIEASEGEWPLEALPRFVGCDACEAANSAIAIGDPIPNSPPCAECDRRMLEFGRVERVCKAK